MIWKEMADWAADHAPGVVLTALTLLTGGIAGLVIVLRFGSFCQACRLDSRLVPHTCPRRRRHGYYLEDVSDPDSAVLFGKDQPPRRGPAPSQVKTRPLKLGSTADRFVRRIRADRDR